jgi:hypothetical protein
MTAWLRHVWCRLRGHALELRVEQVRVCLHCTICDYVSPGWSWLPAPPAARSVKVLRFQKRVNPWRMNEEAQ